MKPFDLEEAKSGKPVCIKSGRKARIICFDRKDEEFNIVALVEADDSEEILVFTNEGKYYTDTCTDRNLMMAPIKRNGWINLYKSETDRWTGNIFYSEHEAEKVGKNSPHYIKTMCIEWEE